MTLFVLRTSWLGYKALLLHKQYTFRIFLFNTSKNISEGLRALVMKSPRLHLPQLVTEKAPKQELFLNKLGYKGSIPTESVQVV